MLSGKRNTKVASMCAYSRFWAPAGGVLFPLRRRRCRRLCISQPHSPAGLGFRRRPPLRFSRRRHRLDLPAVGDSRAQVWTSPPAWTSSRQSKGQDREAPCVWHCTPAADLRTRAAPGSAQGVAAGTGSEGGPLPRDPRRWFRQWCSATAPPRLRQWCSAIASPSSVIKSDRRTSVVNSRQLGAHRSRGRVEFDEDAEDSETAVSAARARPSAAAASRRRRPSVSSAAAAADSICPRSSCAHRGIVGVAYSIITSSA